MNIRQFENRTEAGKILSKILLKFQGPDTVVLALPRGGVPIAYEIATKLKAPLDVAVVKKIGIPGNEEYAIGAVGEDEKPLLNQKIIHQYKINPEEIERVIVDRIFEIRKRIKDYRKVLPAVSLQNKVAIVVDDGLATGATMMAAIEWLRSQEIKKIIVAVPVSSVEAAEFIKHKVDDFVSLITPENMRAVGMWYKEFTQVSDEEVLQLLQNNTFLEKNIETKITAEENIVSEIEAYSVPFTKVSELNSWIRSISKHKIIMMGESTHGTKEFYRLRREISEKLIQEYGYSFIAVEGDWPDCYKVNQSIASPETHGTKDHIKNEFHRWPTWMWANEEIPPLINWMKKNQMGGFYGLDVYSLFDSLEEIKMQLENIDPTAGMRFLETYKCFESYGFDEVRYAKSLFNTNGCHEEVLTNLKNILRLRLQETRFSKEGLFATKQNARIIANAEKYYRAMSAGGAESWNVRDQHMMETLENLLNLHGPDAKAIVWAHNTHIGDYHATDMSENGYLNIGGLARERFGVENVFLLGFSTYEGEVTAGSAWGGAEKKMHLPKAREGSYEDYFHQAALNMKAGQFLTTFNQLDKHSPLNRKLGHRAVGVVYDPAHESRSNYVPTMMGSRYDGLMFVDRTTAIKSLHSIYLADQFPETWPQGQ